MARLGLDRREVIVDLLHEPAPDRLREAIPVDSGERLLWPVLDGVLGRGFGYVRRAELAHRLHKGVDIPAPAGALIRAATGGLVVYADNGIRGYGNLVMILTAEGELASYAHCREVYVSAGELVRQGDTIGEVGMTGLAPAPHLHFEWRRDGVPRDPTLDFVDRPSRRNEAILRCAFRRHLSRSERRVCRQLSPG